MRKLYTSLGGKIAAVMLSVILLGVFLASGFGVGYMIYYNVYSDGGDGAREDVLDDYIRMQGYEAASYYEAVLNSDANAAYPSAKYRERFAAKNTNYCFVITDDSGKILLKNESCDAAQYTMEDDYNVMRITDRVSDKVYFNTEEERQKYLTNLYQTYDTVDYSYEDSYDDVDTPRLTLNYTCNNEENITVHIAGKVRAELSAKDGLYTKLFWLGKLVGVRIWLIITAITSLFFFVLLVIFLLCAAGHKEGVEGIHLNWADRVPFDLYLFFLFLLCLPPLYLSGELGGGMYQCIALCICGLWWYLLLLAAVMSFATRTKAPKSWWRNTLLFRLIGFGKHLILWFCHGIRYFWSNLPLIWRNVIGIFCLVLYNIILISMQEHGARISLLLCEALVLVPIAILAIIGLGRLERGAQALAKGELGTPVDTRHLFGTFRRFGENLNHINDGISAAVEARMKSERMKTELITNVSHDIKTPLTSIINYVDLLKKEEPENEASREYLEVLDRQSARLKKLIVDLVEASKASSGSIGVNLAPCEIGVLLSQTVGEYTEKTEAKKLELVLQQPDTPVTILADGQHLWRVFDNLMNNICKYSLENTRVYLGLTLRDAKAEITFRNISRAPLNITSEELMERFVRGDSSRNTEGSGLGLSIAKSLVELQGGSFSLHVDGDLFKVTLTFDTIKEA